jgi:hypothetical protein
MKLRTVWMAALALLGAARGAHAQAPATAEQSARAFLAALDGGRWDEAAGYVLPSAARRERDLDISMRIARLEMMAKGQRSGNFTVASSGVVDPEKLRRFGSTPVRSLRGVSTLAQAAALAPEVYMARTMEMAMTRFPGSSAAPPRHPFLGIVVENDSVAHALYREQGGVLRYGDPAAAEVLELRRSGGRWYVLPGMTLLTVASMHFDDEFPKRP